MRFRTRALLTGVSIATAGALLTACDSEAYKSRIVTTCKGNEITVGQMELELKAAGYNHVLDGWKIDEELAAYNRASCDSRSVITCKEEEFGYQELERRLRLANYPGPFDHGQKDLEAYNRAACPERG